MKQKKHPIFRFFVVVIAAFSFLVARWRKTPYGDLHPLMAILRRMMPTLSRDKMTLEELEAQRKLMRMTPSVIRYGEVDIEEIPGPASPIPVMIIRPETEGPHPIIVYYHGGGFASGNIESHKNTTRRIAKETESVVISVEYRLAPEHTFPAAIDDAYAAFLWAYENREMLNGWSDQIIVAGDSAGGNLAAAVSLRARDEGGPNISLQVLLYPYLTMLDRPFESRLKFDNYMLGKKDLDQFSLWYTPEDEMKRHPYASPLEADDLSHLPPAYIATAEFDVLHDEGIAYAVRLREAGNIVFHRNFEGMLHGFVSYVEIGGTLDVLLPAPSEIFRDLRLLIRDVVSPLEATKMRVFKP